MTTFLAILLLSHSVTLHWNAPVGGTKPDHYRIFRATVSGGPYQELGEVLAARLSATNGKDLVEGQNYCYVVQSVAHGQASGNSNEACTTIPVSGVIGPRQPVRKTE